MSVKIGDFFKKEFFQIYFMSSGIVQIFSEAKKIRPSHIRKTEGNITFRMEGGETSSSASEPVKPAGEMSRLRLF